MILKKIHNKFNFPKSFSPIFNIASMNSKPFNDFFNFRLDINDQINKNDNNK